MITKSIAITRLCRDLNTVARKLTRGDIDVYIVTRRGRPILALISCETAEQWRIDLERTQEFTRQLRRISERVSSGNPAAPEGKE